MCVCILHVYFAGTHTHYHSVLSCGNTFCADSSCRVHHALGMLQPKQPTLESIAEPTSASTPATATPAELYYDEYWKDLPQAIQEAYAVLGMDEHKWDNGIPSDAGQLGWDELAPDVQQAALSIGYTEEIWCATPAPAESPIPPMPVEPAGTTSSSTVNEDPAEKPSVEAGHYSQFGWSDLPSHAQVAASTLGWDQAKWDGGGTAWSDEKYWDELPPEAQRAAFVLGYEKWSWDGTDPVTGNATKPWAHLELYGFDDDYLFDADPSEAEVWVSQYQVLYFFAALCFLLTGLLELYIERHVFHIFMVLAGAFGMASAIFVESDVMLSNIFNAVSVHLYLLEGLSWFSDFRRSAFEVEYGKWMNRFIMLADLEFVLGALADVIVRKSTVNTCI